MAEEAKMNNRAVSIGLLGIAVDVLNYMINENFIPDVITDQTAHDILDGYIPNRMSLDEANDLRKTNPKKYEKESIRTIYEHCQAILTLQERGSVAFD